MKSPFVILIWIASNHWMFAAGGSGYGLNAMITQAATANEALFDSLDISVPKDDVIDKQELQNWGSGMSPSAAQDILDAFGTDKLVMDDFNTLIAFVTLDTDYNNVISKDEIQTAIDSGKLPDGAKDMFEDIEEDEIDLEDLINLVAFDSLDIKDPPDAALDLDELSILNPRQQVEKMLESIGEEKIKMDNFNKFMLFAALDKDDDAVIDLGEWKESQMISNDYAIRMADSIGQGIALIDFEMFMMFIQLDGDMNAVLSVDELTVGMKEEDATAIRSAFGKDINFDDLKTLFAFFSFDKNEDKVITKQELIDWGLSDSDAQAMLVSLSVSEIALASVKYEATATALKNAKKSTVTQGGGLNVAQGGGTAAGSTVTQGGGTESATINAGNGAKEAAFVVTVTAEAVTDDKPMEQGKNSQIKEESIADSETTEKILKEIVAKIGKELVKLFDTFPADLKEKEWAKEVSVMTYPQSNS